MARSLASCQGALLLVDSTQSVQAQTLANHAKAKTLGKRERERVGVGEYVCGSERERVRVWEWESMCVGVREKE